MIPVWMKLLDMAAMFGQAFIVALYFNAIHKPIAKIKFIIFLLIGITTSNILFVLFESDVWIKMISYTLFYVISIHFITKASWLKSIFSCTLFFVVSTVCEASLFLTVSPWLEGYEELDLRLGSPVSVFPRWLMLFLMATALFLTAMLWKLIIEKQHISRFKIFVLLPASQYFAICTFFLFVGLESNLIYHQQAGLRSLLILVFAVANISLFYALRHTLQYDYLQRENELLHSQLQMQEERELQLAHSQNQVQQLGKEMIAQLEAIRPFIPHDPNHPAASMMERISAELEREMKTNS